jgi:hypothetical protein
LLRIAMYSLCDTAQNAVGFPIQKFWSITVFITLTRLIAD